MRWLLLDVGWIILFALLGRQSHDGDSGPLAVLGVAAPFLVGYAIAALLTNLRRRPRSPTRGAVVWVVTLVIGMAVRTVLDGRLPDTAFVLVATGFLAAGLIGWRLIALLVCRRRADTDATQQH